MHGNTLEDHRPLIAIAFSPFRALAKTKGQRGVGLDADQLNVGAIQSLSPAGIGPQDGEVVLDVLLALDLIAIIDPVAKARRGMPGQVAAPVVGMKHDRTPIVVTLPLIMNL